MACILPGTGTTRQGRTFQLCRLPSDGACDRRTFQEDPEQSGFGARARDSDRFTMWLRLMRAKPSPTRRSCSVLRVARISGTRCDRSPSSRSPMRSGRKGAVGSRHPRFEFSGSLPQKGGRWAGRGRQGRHRINPFSEPASDRYGSRAVPAASRREHRWPQPQS